MKPWSAGETSRTTVAPPTSPAATTSTGVTRSRTNFFLSIRASSTRPARTSRRLHSPNYEPDDDSNEESQGLLSAGDRNAGHVAISFDPLPPNWISISDQVQGILNGTRNKIATLDKLHAKHVLPGFADRSAEEREIEALTTDITRDFRKCGNFIQQITPDTSSNAEAHTFPPGQPTRHQVLTAQNVQRGLAAKVQDLSGAFRKKQRVYMQKLQGHAIKNQDLLIASGAISLKGTDSLTELEEDVEASRSQLTTQQLLHQNPSNEVETRTREITEIAKSIASLAEVFKDLSTLVIDQGTILDSVEYNIEQTVYHVQEAEKDLNVATRYQKNTGRRKVIFLLMLIIIGLILVLIFKPRRSSPPPTLAARHFFSLRGSSRRTGTRSS